MEEVTKNDKTYTFLQLLDKVEGIEIPIIQRDFAQGREKVEDIRNEFLESLKSILEIDVVDMEHLIPLDLDFIYGSIENKKFIPLDGQQRLTTLFLLHWYFAQKDGSINEFKTKLSKNGFSKFSYKTRASAKEFCDGLINNLIDIDKLLLDDNNKKSLSLTIIDSSWFFLSWLNDPTIKSMLIMLDSIHDNFQSIENGYEKLANTKTPYITFQYLPLKEFKLTDELYIKMNARGKALTPFETFKAKFEQYIENLFTQSENDFKLEFDGIARNVSTKEYFSHKIDTDWADLFWQYQNNNIYDEQLMNFIRVMIIGHYAADQSNRANGPLNILINDTNDNIEKTLNEKISFSKYVNWNCFDKKSIKDLINILDILKNGNNKIKNYLENDHIIHENYLFETAIKNEFVYSERVQYFAYTQYLIRYFEKSNYEFQNNLTAWMRVIRNLTENTAYNTVNDFKRSMRSVSQLMKSAPGILTYLIDDNNKIEGFAVNQLSEERTKAKLILKSVDWKEAIIKADNHRYFLGQIDFLLKFADITISSIDNWSVDENNDHLGRFNDYYKKACLIFNKDGVIEFSNFLWERALLTKGDYLLHKGARSNFLTNADRDLSWKRLLRGSEKDKSLDEKRNYIKEVFDEISLSQNIEGELKNIVINGNTSGWRSLIIKYPETIKYCEHRFIQKYNNNRDIILISKSTRASYQAHLKTYCLYLEYKAQPVADFAPFTKVWYYEEWGESVYPCAVIDNWNYSNSSYAIDINYLEDQTFKIRFFDRENQSYDDVDKILKNKGFQLTEHSFTKIVGSQKEVTTSINDLIDNFRELILSI